MKLIISDNMIIDAVTKGSVEVKPVDRQSRFGALVNFQFLLARYG